MPNAIHRFAGRTAIVSGGAGGMGAACVERLAMEGARVFALDIDGAMPQPIVREDRIHAHYMPDELVVAVVIGNVVKRHRNGEYRHAQTHRYLAKTGHHHICHLFCHYHVGLRTGPHQWPLTLM